MYIYAENYSERALEAPLNLSPSPDRESGLLHSYQNDARAFYAPMLKRISQ
jgi:hypothetical protein